MSAPVQALDPQKLEDLLWACCVLYDLAVEAEADDVAPQGSGKWLEQVGRHCSDKLRKMGLLGTAGSLH